MLNLISKIREYSISQEIRNIFSELEGGNFIDYGYCERGLANQGTKPNLESLDQDPTLFGGDLISSDNNIKEE